jgi:hypothetical protein
VGSFGFLTIESVPPVVIDAPTGGQRPGIRRFGRRAVDELLRLIIMFVEVVPEI